MQVLDTPLLNTKDSLELYLLQLKANSAMLVNEMNALNTAVELEVAFIETLIKELK